MVWKILACCFANLFFLSVLLTSACVSKCNEYKYYDFADTSGARIVQMQVPNTIGLHGVTAFPTSYIITRPRYKLVIRVDQSSYLPTFTVSPAEGAFINLTVTSSPADLSLHNYCYSFKKIDEAISITWLETQSCGDRGHIDLAVKGKGGQLIASDELRFQMVSNGRYCINDGL